MNKDEIIDIIFDYDNELIKNNLRESLLLIEKYRKIEIHLSLDDFKYIQNKFDFHKKFNDDFFESFESIIIENRFIEII